MHAKVPVVLAAALALALALAAAPVLAQDPKERTTEGVGLTVYSAPGANQQQQGQQVWDPELNTWKWPDRGYAVVKEWRKVAVGEGRSTVRFTDVPRRIEAHTVHFRSLTDPAGTAVVEQTFEYDLVSADKILHRYVDRPIAVTLSDGKVVDGTLLSFDAGQLVLRTADAAQPLVILQRATVKDLRFSALPGGLITRPTLVWDLHAKKGGEHLVKVTYETGGMSWEADYNAVVSKGDDAVDLGAWVTIRNLSGATFKDAELKLVAGDVHRAPTTVGQNMDASMGMRFAAESIAMPPGFSEKAFFEYHLYTLGRTTTLADNSTKQIEMFRPVDRVPCRKLFVYDGALFQHPWYGSGPNQDQNFGVGSNPRVDIYLEFKNGKEQGLGMPLPGGRVRVHKRDEADGSLEFVGEDRIGHTPKDEKVRLRMGTAFDVVGERKQMKFEVNHDQRWVRESFEIRVRNHKDEEVEVRVKEALYRWVNGRIDSPSTPFETLDSRTVHFPVKVAKDGEAVVTYTVVYTW